MYVHKQFYENIQLDLKGNTLFACVWLVSHRRFGQGIEKKSGTYDPMFKKERSV